VNWTKARSWIVVTGLAVAGVIAACQRPFVAADELTDEAVDSIVAASNWVGCDTVPRDAENGATTNVEICASEAAITYGARPGQGPPVPMPVARMRNLGDAVELRWGLQPHRTYIIRLWDHPPTGRTGYSVDGPGIPTQTGTYHACAHAKVDNSSRATFGSCADTLPSGEMPGLVGGGAARGPSASAEPAAERHRLFDIRSGPAWITCETGCCTTGAM
jgi:hypothetical protein